ncbi:GNAT family N-acetyltransferase [uncultured Desulfosarcina sp.]|uniref:GNAT family N-acetyltransferase n=1 Tax=uncultured Desulfosarcina sp. TaxID=218289 RepID=UPI0029C68723|nr:GNAT family N-acetyltransferase [uncultured Desulfosarcina sp.]
MEIKADDLSGPEVKALLDEHLQHMIAVTPPGCVHALDYEALKSPEISFWTVWEGSSLLGCGALKKLSHDHAEIKSMRTATPHQGKGVASHLLQFILDEARKCNYRRVSLETGSFDAFLPARRLYEKFGFTYRKPFADYMHNNNSVFMTIEL